jgi:hypothetical protein
MAAARGAVGSRGEAGGSGAPREQGASPELKKGGVTLALERGLPRPLEGAVCTLGVKRGWLVVMRLTLNRRTIAEKSQKNRDFSV